MPRASIKAAVAVTTLLGALALSAGAAVAKPRIAHVTLDGDKGEMTLWVDIRKGDNVVKTVEKGKLQIMIDGKPLAASPEVTYYGDRGDGYSVVFVVDAGDIWDRNWAEIKEAVKGFVSRMRGDKFKVALVLLREGRVDTAVPFTSEINDVGEYLDKITETAGIEPRLFNAISLAIKMHAEESANWRRIIVFGTDLEDESTMDPMRYSAAYVDLLKELDKADVEISTIFMTNKLSPSGEPDVDPKVVTKAKKLAEKSNGFFRELRGVAGVAGAFKEVADDVNAMAVVTIKPDIWKEGMHLVTVRYDELDSKDLEVSFPPPPKPTDNCEIDADCPKGEKCRKGEHPWSCEKADAPPPAAKEVPFDLFAQWWFWALCGLGGLGFIVLIIALVSRRGPPEPAPMMAPQPGGGCMECGQPMKAGPRCMEQCAQRARGKFVVTAGPMVGKIFYILEDITTFGKAPGNNYMLMDESVSSKHFGIKIEDARYELADFGSTNGSFVNGTKATKQYLKVGDVVRVGQTEMTFNLK